MTYYCIFNVIKLVVSSTSIGLSGIHSSYHQSHQQSVEHGWAVFASCILYCIGRVTPGSKRLHSHLFALAAIFMYMYMKNCHGGARQASDPWTVPFQDY